jgi:glutaminyl-tRNA synthetase
VEAPDAEGRDFKQFLNPRSLEILTAKVEPSLAEATPEARYQFERLAYFCVDGKESRPGHPIFNRTITLKDTWAKEAQKG